MTAAHLSEYENWPGVAREPPGRRPTPYLLSLLAAVYGCAVYDLLDVADYRRMPAADRLILDKTTPARESLPASTVPSPAPAAAAQLAEYHPAQAARAGEAHDIGINSEAVLRGRGYLPATGTALLAALESCPPGHNDADARALAAGLLRYETEASERDRAVMPPAGLRNLVDTGKKDYQACRYRKLTASLPLLLEEGEYAAANLRGDSRQDAHALLAEAYHVAASLLLKAGNRGLACVMADRSMHAARASEDVLAIGSSARILAHVLLDTGHSDQATSLARTTAAKMTAGSPPATPEWLSVYGSLLLRGAIAAARSEDRSAALELLGEADEAAGRLGADANHYWTAFGPVNVLLHRVNIAATLSDAGIALSLAGKVNPQRIGFAERKASFWIDVARARAQRRQYDQALLALLAAEESAPEEVQARSAVRSLVAELYASHPRRPAPLAEFAARVGHSHHDS
jgi:hypothetical protein